MENTRRVGIYIRVSTLDQAEEGYSVEEQEDKLKKYCEIKDWKVVQIYRDAGFTGSNIERPGMTSLIKDIEHNKLDTVLVYKLDRLSRSQKDTLYLIEDVFAKKNVDFISLNENFDTSTAFGKAMIGILSVFAQLEREQIKERMQMGKQGRAKTGKAMSWSRIPFGYSYENDTYIINELEAAIIKSMFENYLNGMSITKIIDLLNDDGHIGKDIRWSYRTIKFILTNPLYSGYNSFKGELYKGNHQPIISKETFDLVQSEINIRQQQTYAKNNNPRPFQSKYMLSGLLKCGYCGSRFEIQLGVIRKDGTRFKKYKCYSQTSKRHSVTNKRPETPCKSPVYNLEELEVHVLNAIEQLQIDTSTLDSISNNNNWLGEKKRLKEEVKILDKRLEKLADLYMEEIIPIEQLREKTDKLQNTKHSILKKIEANDKNDNSKNKLKAKNMLNNLNQNIKDLDYEGQKEIVRALVSEIVLKEDSIAIRWSFLNSDI